jgi:hypothetical protein
MSFNKTFPIIYLHFKNIFTSYFKSKNIKNTVFLIKYRTIENIEVFILYRYWQVKNCAVIYFERLFLSYLKVNDRLL